MKKRNIALAIVFSIITFGIYGLYWFVVITNDTNYFSRNNKTSDGIVALLLTIITCNIYGWYWAYKLGEKVDEIKRQNGMPSSSSGILFIILQALGLGIVNYALAQDALNSAITRQQQGFGNGYDNYDNYNY